MRQVADALRKTAGVTGVEVNHRTGSILVHHEEVPAILEAVEKTVADVSVDLLEALVETGSPAVAGLTVGAHLIANLFTAANSSLSGATSNVLDLKTVVPLAFLGLGVWRLRRAPGEDLLMTISPIVLFYYAFDTYWKLQVEKPGLQASESTAALAARKLTPNDKRIAAQDKQTSNKT